MNNEQNKTKFENKQFNKQTNKQQTINSFILKPFLMKKIFVFAAIAASVLAVGCAKNEVVQNVTKDGKTPVSFGVYNGRMGTKAVSATDFGPINSTANLEATTNGFGVFAYYTGDDPYASTTAANFMYNEQVQYTDTDGDSVKDTWTYSPVKYWPNEHGSTAVSPIVDEGDPSEHYTADKLTFLVYAPYVASVGTEGITSMTANNVAEDAKLGFTVPASTAQQIDLMYGVLGSVSTNVEGGTDGAVNGPIADLTKQECDGEVDILFKHALAKAQIDIRTIVDQVAATSSVDPSSDGTLVVVKDLNIIGGTSANVIGTQGILNLYTGAWSSVTGTSSFAVDPLPDEIKVNAQPTSQPTIKGVLEGGLTDANYTPTPPGKIDLMFIPGGQIVGVEIVYYVCTADAKLGVNSGASIIENHITKNFGTPITVTAGKQYNITINLGLTSIKLDASVDPWDEEAKPIDLPANVA